MAPSKRFPNTGFALVLTSHALNHAYDSLLPLLYPSLIQEFGLSYGLVGMLAMGYRLTGGALQLVMGFLSRFVRRKFLLGLGMVWHAATNFTLSFAQGFEHLLASRSLAGIGTSPQHPVGSSYIAENFPRERLGRALGTNILVAAVGRFVTPPIASLLLPGLGWKTTVILFSIPGFLVGVSFLFTAEARRPRSWDGASSFRLLFGGLRDVLRSRIVLTVMVVEAVMAFRMGSSDFLPAYFMRGMGLSPLDSGLLFAVFLGSGLPAPYVWGRLSDRLERRRVVMLTMGAASLLWYLLPYAVDYPQLLIILVLLGFVCQGIGGVVQAYVAEATTLENRDLIYGIYFSLAFAFGALSPVIFGHLADSFGFRVGFLYVGAMSLSAVAASYLLR